MEYDNNPRFLKADRCSLTCFPSSFPLGSSPQHFSQRYTFMSFWPRAPSLLLEVSPSKLRPELQTTCSDGKNPGLAVRKPGLACCSLWWKDSDVLFSGSHGFSLSGPWAPLLCHREAVTFSRITFCNFVIRCQGPRLGLSLRGPGDGNGYCGTATEYCNLLEAGFILLAWWGLEDGSIGMRNQVHFGKRLAKCKTNLLLCHGWPSSPGLLWGAWSCWRWGPSPSRSLMPKPAPRKGPGKHPHTQVHTNYNSSK